MKRILVILLLIIYSASTINATVHLHYCMNRFVGWSFLESKEEHKCGKCGMMGSNNGCCNEKHLTIDLDVDQKTPSIHSFEKSFNLELLPQEFYYRLSSVKYSGENIVAYQFPPGKFKARIHLLFCVYLI